MAQDGTEDSTDGAVCRCRAVKAVLWLLALAPALWLAWLVYRFGVNIPYWDQWDVATLFDLAHRHQLSFDYLISQHNESRKFFPRLLILGLGKLTHWNTRYEMGVIVALAALVSINIYQLSRRTLGGTTERRLILWLFANLLIFSPVQAENWLWGIQIVVFAPIACITTALVLLSGRRSLAVKAAGVTALCVIATFSYANGMLSFIILLPALIASALQTDSTQADHPPRTPWIRLVSCTAFFASFFVGCVWLYFVRYRYTRPASSPPMSDALKVPIATVQYFLVFLGSPLRGQPEFQGVTTSAWIGALLVLLLALILARLAFVRRAPLIARSLPWLVLAAYTMASAILTSIGRVGFGVEQALSSRYTTFSNYLIVPLIYLMAIHLDDWIFRKDRRINWRIGQALCLTSGVILLIGYVPSAACGYRELYRRRSAQLVGKACVEFLPVMDEQAGLMNLYPAPSDRIREMAPKLNRWGYLSPAMIHSLDLTPIVSPSQSKPEGNFETLSLDPANGYFAAGWARLGERHETADAVLLSYDDPQTGHPILVGLAAIHTKRRDVSTVLGDSRYLRSGWYYYVNPAKVPAGALTLTAWAFDAEARRAYKIGTLPIPR